MNKLRLSLNMLNRVLLREDPQNLSHRKIAIVILCSTSWPRIERCVSEVVTSIGSASSGSFVEIPIP